MLLRMNVIQNWLQISFSGNASPKAKLIWSGRSPFHWLATEHFDEHYKRKQTESFLTQSEHTILVSRHRTLRTQYLHLSVFFWKQYIILASYKDFCKLQCFCLCAPLLPYFSGTYLLKLSFYLTFVTRWSVSVVIIFYFFRSRFY